MAGAWDRWGGVVLVTALAIPVLALLVVVRARRPAGPAILDAAAEVGSIAGTLPWLWMILTPSARAGAVHPVPFQELPEYLDLPLIEVVVQIGGNLAVFAALGALAPVRWRIGPLAVAAIAAVGSVTVETLQFALDLGRVSSVDDVLLNTAGALLAALVTRRWWRIRRERTAKSDATLCR